MPTPRTVDKSASSQNGLATGLSDHRWQLPVACQCGCRECSKYRDALIAEYHKYPALPPVFDFMDNEAPAKVRKMKPVWTEDGYILFWTAPKYKEEMNRAVQYVVYRFNDKEKVNIDDPSIL